MATYKIVDRRRVPSVDPDRLGKFDLMIVYERPGGGRDLLILPEDEVSAMAVKEAIRKAEEKLKELDNLEFEL